MVPNSTEYYRQVKTCTEYVVGWDLTQHPKQWERMRDLTRVGFNPAATATATVTTQQQHGDGDNINSDVNSHPDDNDDADDNDDDDDGDDDDGDDGITVNDDNDYDNVDDHNFHAVESARASSNV